tara:strand:- start:4070 stop:4975 length:906 start_codon:yes stop_codon:yes gene_type:complete
MTGTKTEWKEQTSKIGWTNVPPNVNKLLTILKGRYVYYTPDPEERTKTTMKQLSEQMTEEEIKSSMAWLEEHRKQYAFSSKNPRGYSRDVQYVRLNVPYTLYRRYGGNYRGITSTVVWNQFNIKRKGMENWQAIVDAHWDKRTAFKDEEALRVQRQHLGNIVLRVENEEKNAKGVLSKDKIRECLLKTFDAYRCGSTSSSHGAWSFGLSYSTRFIVNDPDRYEYRELDKEYKAGDLMDEPDYQKMIWEIKDDARIIDGTLVVQLPALAERLVAATKVQYQASKDWHEVMNDIYNKMKEMIE